MDILADFLHEFRRYKKQADQAVAQMEDATFFERPGVAVNPAALIVKHVAGNLTSRFTDFLTSDGEKPDRDRDGEFTLTSEDTRSRLLRGWESGWKTLFDSLAELTPDDLDRTITIRGEAHSVYQAILRSLSHTAYHIGQILYLARLGQPDSKWLTVPPGQSRQHSGKYRNPT